MPPTLRPSLLGALALVAWPLCGPGAAAQAWESDIVYEGADGRLVYVSDEEGNRVPDFSYAGYRAGGVPLPDVPTRQTVAPGDGDDTAAIQAAIDAVSALAPGADGFRGAVQLAPGTYEVDGTITIRESGVVLRGAGDGDDPATSTVLRRLAQIQAPIILVGRAEAGSGEAIIRRDNTRSPATITDDVVPVGSRSFRVDRPERYAAGDPVVVFHPSTIAWLNAIDGGGTGDDPRWGVNSVSIGYAREVASIVDSLVTLDAPIFTTLDRSLSPSYLYLRDRTGVIEEVGVENLRIDIETTAPTSETQAKNAVVFELVEHGWVRGVTALHFWHAGVSVHNSRYVTVRGSRALEPHSIVTGERRYNFEVDQSQLVLFEDNLATYARHAYVGNGERLDSGIAFVGNASENAYTSSESHRRWGQGFLFDGHAERGAITPERRVHLGNRGDYGTAHGWACVHCVAWNCDMESGAVVVEKPPTAQNYAIGTMGRATNDGPFTNDTDAYIEGTDRPGLAPQSLYRRQLQDRGIVVSSEAPPAGGKTVLFPAAPNPTRGRARLGFSLETPAAVRLALYDVLGREVAVVADGAYGAGVHEARLDTAGLPAGLYLYRLTATGAGGTTQATRRLTVLR